MLDVGRCFSFFNLFIPTFGALLTWEVHQVSFLQSGIFSTLQSISQVIPCFFFHLLKIEIKLKCFWGLLGLHQYRQI